MRAALRQNLIVVLMVVATFSLVYAVNRATSKEPSVSLNNCQPRDLWARLTRAYDPRGFWIDQHMTLEDIYSPENFREVLDDCEIQPSSAADQEQCRVRYREIWQKATRCLEHAAKMCRFEGGRC